MKVDGDQGLSYSKNDTNSTIIASYTVYIPSLETDQSCYLIKSCLLDRCGHCLCIMQTPFVLHGRKTDMKVNKLYQI